ncbi:MAG: ABC transporter permease [Alphaproteobacteria bacterium]|nr:ABC transporter permease [Alphaproteobacteria bacterium]
MFRNYLITALRNIARYKLHSFINIAGLAIGLTSAILIILFVRDELSYDKWIKGSENLWRLEITYHVPGRSEPIVTAQSPIPIVAAIREQIPEVTSGTRLVREGMTLTDPSHPDRQFSQNIGVVDPNFLQVIPLPLVKGDPRTVLSRPENLVISESAARKYFGDADPMGRTLTTGRGGCVNDAACANTTVTLRVVGVMRDLPSNTQLDFDYLMPNTSLADRIAQEDKKSWVSNSNYFGYVTLAPGADPATVVAKMKPIFDRNVDISAFTNVKIPGSQILEAKLTHFTDAHLNTDRDGGMKPPGSWTTLYGMMVIGALILLVACFNFMNLATARATLRAREISLRKCMGAKRGQIIVQFLGEAVLMSLIALVLAFALAEVLLPSFGTFMGRPLPFRYLSDWPLTLGTVVIAVLAGLISGLYPALVLSGFRPGATLRTNASGQSGSGRLRAGLVVLQFAVSIGLGIGALVVFQQIEYARNIDLGFNRENIVVTGTAGRLTGDGVKSFMQALARGPGVLQVTRSSFMPFNGNNSVLPTQRPGDASFLSPTHYSVSEDYFRLYGIKVLAGRVLQDNREEDNFYDGPNGDQQGKNEGHNVMVNAALAHALGYAPADIIGQTFIFGKAHLRVIGVTADVLAEGVRNKALQTVYVHQPENMQTILIRIAPGRTQETMEYIAKVQRQFVHGVALSRTLLSDSYDRLFASDKRQGAIFGIFVAIAIVIASMGLFGLAAFTAGRRTKEIGIRKVFGARDRNIIIMLLWQFSVPVLIANLIAWPLAWYYLSDWLKGFAYRIDLNSLYFVAVGFGALLIAWFTILGHALRVARANPIHALRYE